MKARHSSIGKHCIQLSRVFFVVHQRTVIVIGKVSRVHLVWRWWRWRSEQGDGRSVGRCVSCGYEKLPVWALLCQWIETTNREIVELWDAPLNQFLTRIFPHTRWYFYVKLLIYLCTQQYVEYRWLELCGTTWQGKARQPRYILITMLRSQRSA